MRLMLLLQWYCSRLQKVLEKLAVLTIPEDAEQQEEDRVLVLDSRFSETPAVAMEQCRTATIECQSFQESDI